MAYLQDIKPTSHGSRTARHLKSIAGEGADTATLISCLSRAEAEATAEMLNEVHQMLCHLCGIKE